jgi:hypothetical protein
MTTEEQLKAVIAKVEQSDISREEKDEIYTMISKNLHEAVMPVLVKYMSQDKLMEFSKAPEKVTVEEYYALLADAFEDGKAVEELNQIMQGILQSVDASLK